MRAHILVCFLAYVLWKTLAALCRRAGCVSGGASIQGRRAGCVSGGASIQGRRAGLGDEPRRVLKELAELRIVDVVLPTDQGAEIRRRCITRPSDHQEILLHHLGLTLPQNINSIEMS